MPKYVIGVRESDGPEVAESRVVHAARTVECWRLGDLAYECCIQTQSKILGRNSWLMSLIRHSSELFDALNVPR